MHCLAGRHWVYPGTCATGCSDRGVEAARVEVLHWFADVDSCKPDGLTLAKVRARLE